MNEEVYCKLCGNVIMDGVECGCFDSCTAKRLKAAADKLFGVDCEEINTTYKPLPSRTRELIDEAIELIADGRIEKVSLTLDNGETAKITAAKVERNKKINSAVTQ